MTIQLQNALVKPEQQEQFFQEGFMVLERVIPDEMLQMLREECSYALGYCDAEIDFKGDEYNDLTRRGSRYFINNKYRRHSRLWQFIFSPLMAEISQSVLGPDVYLFHEQWVVKGAERGMKFSWHQDSGYVKDYMPYTQHKPYLTCWCALDDVSEANGTVFLLPHSRAGTRDTILEHTRQEVSNDLIGYTGTDPGDKVEVPAGSIVAFSSFSLHRSGANTTDKMRRIYLPQYSSEPILTDANEPWALAVPFVSNGQIVYDHANDTTEL